MKLIQPAEISGKIMTLIDQAESELIIVSPYNNITSWKKLTNRINKARKRGVKIKWYIRKTDGNAQQITELGITPVEVENLHAKIYLNEKNAVVTSMNLVEFSDSSSLDIGYYISAVDKHAELKLFIQNYIDLKVDSAVQGSNKVESAILDEVLAEQNRRATEKFYKILKEKILKYKGLYSEVTKIENKYGVGISLEKFMTDFNLRFEPKGVYFRIDLRIDHILKREYYNLLLPKQKYLESVIGMPVDYGQQMKRLRIDLVDFEHYDYRKWGSKEFSRLGTYMQKSIDSFEYVIRAIQKKTN